MPLPEENKHFTYADYLEWNDDERMEIINGEVIMRSSPTATHQRISKRIFRQIENFLDGKSCEPFYAPFDVRLFEKDGDKPENIDTIVQPDILVICDKNKIDEQGCKGAPNFIIEILSPSTHRHDCLVKLNLYMRAGVPEYWIVDPEGKTVQVCLLNNDGTYRILKPYEQNNTVKVNVLDGCFIDLGTVFPEE